MARTQKTAVLGSGHIYIQNYTGTLPSIANIISACSDANRFGTTTGGATLTYTGEIYVESDDMGLTSATVLTKEEAKLKLGVFSWTVDNIQKLASTVRVTTEGDYKVARIGGLNNDDRKNYIVVFEHVDKINGNMYCIIVGKNSAGLSFAWAKDAVTKLEPEFTAVPQDNDGTLVALVEAPVASSGGGSGGEEDPENP